MSLKSFLSDPSITAFFRKHVQKPSIRINAGIAAAPITRRYSLVGTAFDYLLRFHLKRLNPNAIERPWVAEWSLTSPLSPVLQDVEIDLVSQKVISYRKTSLTDKIEQILQNSRKHYECYISGANLSEELCAHVLMLVQIDLIVRARFIDPNLGNVDPGDIRDLQQLLKLINSDTIKVDQICLLNPTFGNDSRMVKGADADLILDDTLVEIKTTKKATLDRGILNELVGYWILSRIGGIDNSPEGTSIIKLGVYFARYGTLITFAAEDVVTSSALPDFESWFQKAADRLFPKQSYKGE